MKLLIIGKTGQLGGALIEDAEKRNLDILAPPEFDLDITKISSFLKVIKDFSPDYVINTAAYHNVVQCEENPVISFKVNCLAVREMAEISNEYGFRFVSISTDYVFDGKKGGPYIETDAPSPLQIYGLSKLAGEYAALSYPNSVIIRTCGLYGLQGAISKGGNFVDKRINDSKTLKYLEMSDDQTVSPTYTADLSKAILDLLNNLTEKPGIYHLVNQGFCTWYEFTKEIYKIMNIDIELIPVDRKGLTGKIRRPLFSALKNEKAAKIGIVLPHWKEALAHYLNTKYLK